jgi:hypothetical protein
MGQRNSTQQQGRKVKSRGPATGSAVGTVSKNGAIIDLNSPNQPKVNSQFNW